MCSDAHSITLKKNTISNIFTIYLVWEIPTQKEEQSMKSTKLSLKRKEGIAQ